MLLLVPLIEEPNETQFSQDVDAPSDDFYQVHQAKDNKSLLNHYLDSRGIIPKHPPPLHPRSLLRNMMVLSMSLQKFNTILRPSTNLPRKEVYMSLTLLT